MEAFADVAIVTGARRVPPDTERPLDKPSPRDVILESDQEDKSTCFSQDAQNSKTLVEEKKTKTWEFANRYGKKTTPGPDYGPLIPRPRRPGGGPTPINRLKSNDRDNNSYKLATPNRRTQSSYPQENSLRRSDQQNKRRKVDSDSSSHLIDLEQISERTNSPSREQTYPSRSNVSQSKNLNYSVPEFLKVDETVRFKKRPHKRYCINYEARPSKLLRGTKYKVESQSGKKKSTMNIDDDPTDPIEDEDKEIEIISIAVSDDTPGKSKIRHENLKPEVSRFESQRKRATGPVFSPHFKNTKSCEPDESFDEISASHFKKGVSNKKATDNSLNGNNQLEKGLTKLNCNANPSQSKDLAECSDEDTRTKKSDNKILSSSSTNHKSSPRLQIFPILQVFCCSKLWLLSDQKNIETEKPWTLQINCTAKSLTICDDTNTPAPDLELGRVNSIDYSALNGKICISKPLSAQNANGAHKIYLELKNSEECRRFVRRLRKCDPNVEIRQKDESKFEKIFEKIFENAQKKAKAAPKISELEKIPSSPQEKENLQISSVDSETSKKKDKNETETSVQEPSSNRHRGIAKSMKTRSQSKSSDNLDAAAANSTRLSPQRSVKCSHNSENLWPSRLTRARSGKTTITTADNLEPRSQLKKWTKLNPAWSEQWHVSVVYPREGKNQATVDRADIERLDEGEFINDNLVMFYLRWLQNKIEQESPEISKRIYFYNTFFYERLTKDSQGKTGFNYENVSRWTAKVKLLEYDYIVVPINENLHWYVAIICNAPKLLEKNEISKSSTSSDKMEDTNIDNSKDTDTSKDIDCTKSSTSPIKGPDIHCSGLEVNMKMKEMSLNDQTEEKVGSETDPVLLENSDAEISIISGSVKKKRRKSQQQLRQTSRKHDLFQPRIITLDSFGQAHSLTCTNLKKYLLKEIETKLNLTIEDPGNLGKTAKNIPLQNNYCDCGLFVLGYIQIFLNKPDEFISHLLQNSFPDDTSWPKPSEMRAKIRALLLSLQEEYSLEVEKLRDARSKNKRNSKIRKRESSDKLSSQKESKRTKTSPRLNSASSDDGTIPQLQLNPVLSDDEPIHQPQVAAPLNTKPPLIPIG
ncbi:hypothetical protein K3495_g9216 [Podosphaera aphanis]|nr:hypothetical protein K3495_g9216 [Podosphaera aphanis]